ncbi:hypothetical protein FNV43_RR05818 [Rhamnella rubrinervis]|uniref:Uncharacterized protein n=1 Tax=Rhamnella rubrinervis TaxID=2594499 RepID=A0A8K0HM94_9ROSA|nr:hypothetical protein FNV43_RR05818 [Rhamnella rubrinervis]
MEQGEPSHRGTTHAPASSSKVECKEIGESEDALKQELEPKKLEVAKFFSGFTTFVPLPNKRVCIKMTLASKQPLMIIWIILELRFHVQLRQALEKNRTPKRKRSPNKKRTPKRKRILRKKKKTLRSFLQISSVAEPKNFTYKGALAEPRSRRSNLGTRKQNESQSTLAKVNSDQSQRMDRACVARSGLTLVRGEPLVRPSLNLVKLESKCSLLISPS